MTTFNFTGRQEIDRSGIRLQLKEDAGKILLDVHAIDLPGSEVPATSQVTVEAYRQNTKVRIPCGTIAAPLLPKDVHLEAFDMIDNIQLRLRIIGNAGDFHGMVLAVADHLRMSGDEGDSSAEPLLKMQRKDLDGQVWRFGIDADQPILYINKYLENHDEVINSPLFKALVLPEFFRHVALWIARNRDDSTDPDSTISHWLQFCEAIGVSVDELDALETGDGDAVDDIEEWATEAAATFANDFKALDLLNNRPESEKE